jgi:simple sugar transport system substrate-binding protein
MNQQRRTVVAALAAIGLPLPVLAQQKIVLGFSQIGAESEWRTANTESIKSSAKDAGIDL